MRMIEAIAILTTVFVIAPLIIYLYLRIGTVAILRGKQIFKESQEEQEEKGFLITKNQMEEITKPNKSPKTILNSSNNKEPITNGNQ